MKRRKGETENPEGQALNRSGTGQAYGAGGRNGESEQVRKWAGEQVGK